LPLMPTLAPASLSVSFVFSCSACIPTSRDTADLLGSRPLSSEPSIYTPHGPASVGRTISIHQFLQEQAEHGGPLTGDRVRTRLPLLCCCTAYGSGKDGGNQELPMITETRQGTPELEPLKRRQKKDQRARRRRSEARAKAQVLGSTTLKAISLKKRRPGSTKHALKLPFDVMSCGAATGPGWLGRSLRDLPQRAFTLKDLKRDYGVKCFEWDGRYVTTFFATHFCSLEVQDTPPAP
jgi:hypothetical protein